MDLPVTAEQIQAWKDGAMIQKVMGHLTPGQREFIQTGITEDEWEQMFGSEEE